jgi:cyclic pyranopterin phosphate synthase
MRKENIKDLTHLDESGRPRMVDVGKKGVTLRTAVAESTIILGKEIIELFKNDELHTKKGPVFQTAIIAGIMACKKTHDLIPMCHPLALDHCSIEVTIQNIEEAVVKCMVKTEGKTGVEMEALTGASIAALTIYDMCKSISKSIIIGNTKLLTKTGGKSDFSHE